MEQFYYVGMRANYSDIEGLSMPSRKAQSKSFCMENSLYPCDLQILTSYFLILIQS